METLSDVEEACPRGRVQLAAAKTARTRSRGSCPRRTWDTCVQVFASLIGSKEYCAELVRKIDDSGGAASKQMVSFDWTLNSFW